VFLDGDFIERMLDLPRETQETIVNDAMQRLCLSVDKQTKMTNNDKRNEKDIYEGIDLKKVRSLIESLR
jgi:hypothetical protein